MLSKLSILAVAIICGASLSLAADTAPPPIGNAVENFSLPDFHGQPGYRSTITPTSP